MAGPLAFWAVALVTAALALPIAFRLFRRFPDGGTGLAFPLGLTVAGYLYFILRVFDVLPPGRGGALLAILLLGLCGAWFAGRDARFGATLRRTAPGLIMVAGTFTALFFAYAVARSYSPEISGTEQPMDLMYLNAAMNSAEYPPEDPWLAGERASYYYFGYVQAGMLTRAAGLEADLGYNLSLAYVFAASGTAMVSVAFAAGRWLLPRKARAWAFAAPLASVVLLLGAGTLWGPFAVAAEHEQYDALPYRAFAVESLLPCEGQQLEDCYAGPSPRTTEWYPTRFFWWFDGTRVIPGTITEFPYFSFLLGDLHPHVMSIPLVLLLVAIAAGSWRARGRVGFDTLRREWQVGVVLAVLVGALAFQNAWDLVTFSALLVAAVLARNWRATTPGAAVQGAAGYLGPIGLAGFLADLPWVLDFDSQAGGIYSYVGEGTKPAHALLQYGPVAGPALLVLGIAWVGPLRKADSTAWLFGVAVATLPALAWAMLAILRGDFQGGIDARSYDGWVTLGCLALGVAALTAATMAAAGAGNKGLSLAGAVAGAGLLLLYGSELLLVKDVFFGGELVRMNTVFKLTYQAWILLALAGGVGLGYTGANWRLGNAAWAAPTVAALLVLTGALVYAVYALPSRTDGFAGPTTLDGLAFVARNDPDEYALTNWVREHVPAGTRIVEATGRTWGTNAEGEPVITDGGVDYGPASRISGRTGLPTLIGWAGHEVQWRGESSANRAEFGRRQDLVDAVYLSTTPAEALELLNEAGATYVVVSSLERQRYGGARIADFAAFMEAVFVSGESAVYRVHQAEVIKL